MGNRKETELVNDASEIWDQYYKTQENNKPLGNEYPNEQLVRYISNLRKAPGKDEYFRDSGKEKSLSEGFKGRALELGFGTIANLRMVHKKGFEIDGLEVSEEAVNRGNKSILPDEKITLSHWNPPLLPFEDETFGLAYALQCIYYNLNLEVVVSEIHRCMQPDGKFLFSFFSSNHEYMKYVDFVDETTVRWADDHPSYRIRGCKLRYFKTKENLMDIFGKFSNVRIFTFETDELPMFQSWWYVTGSK